MTPRQQRELLKQDLIKLFHDAYGSVSISTLMLKPCTKLKSSLVVDQNNPIDFYPNIDNNYTYPENMKSIVKYNFSDLGFGGLSNYKNEIIGGGAGLGLGITYGYWDYIDEKKKAIKQGKELPDKKKILIRDSLIGLGLGITLGSVITDKIFKALEDNKATQENKKLYDNMVFNILKNRDKKQLRSYLSMEGDKLTSSQYTALNTLINNISGNNYNNKNNYNNFTKNNQRTTISPVDELFGTKDNSDLNQFNIGLLFKPKKQ